MPFHTAGLGRLWNGPDIMPHRETNPHYNSQLDGALPQHMSRQRGMVLYGPTLTLCWNFQRTCPMSLISPWIIRPSPPILLGQVFPYLLASMSALASSPASGALGLSTVDSTVCDLDSTQYLAPDILDWLDDPLLCQRGSGSPGTACCYPRPSISNADFKANLLRCIWLLTTTYQLASGTQRWEPTEIVTTLLSLLSPWNHVDLLLNSLQ